MRTNMRIPIDGIVSFSWYRIAEAASPIQLVEMPQELAIDNYHVYREAGLPVISLVRTSN